MFALFPLRNDVLDGLRRYTTQDASGSLSRGETRLTRDFQKAQILMLRLSLANYKLRTGQADVPLEELQVRPLPRVSSTRRTPLPSGPARLPSISSAKPQQRLRLDRQESDSSEATNPASEDGEREGDDDAEEVQRDASAGIHTRGHPSPEKDGLPRVSPASAVITPRGRHFNEEENLTSSALRGGAASSLLRLRLARG